MVHPPDLIPGVVLGEQIGVGARSAVHRGVRDGQEYAVKVLRDLGGPAEAVAFSREAALLAALGHPSLPSIHEVGTAAGHPYLIMDLVEGRSLAELLAEQGPLAERELVGLGMDVAGALAIAHAAGLVHRDIKPANIMIGLDGRATLIDFGLAARPGVAEADDAVVGTFVYSAPEQTGMLRRAVDARSDLYSLGAVFFESLTGGPPFAVRDVGELVRRHLSVPAPDVRHLAPAVSPRLAAIVARLLAKDPDDRYQTARELLADLGRLPTSPAGPLPLAAPAVRTPPLLVGRDTELAALLTQYRQASAGGGRVVVLEGPPGIGKSSLLTALARSVAAAPALVLRGGCLPDGALPLAPLREAVEHYVATLDDLPEPTRTTALRRLRTAAGSTGAAVLGRFSPVLAQVLVEPGRASREPEGVTEQQFVDTLAGFVSGLAGDDRSAVLLLDDVQWWDKATREVMRRVVAMLPRTRLLLVLAVRDDGAARQVLESVVDVGPVSLRLPVPPLDERATSALLAARLGSARAPANLIARLSARAGGNPLALVEYLRAAMDAGLLRPAWGRWVLDEQGWDALDLPDDVLNLVLHRVDALGSTARTLLTAAAAVGTRFSAALVSAVAAVDQRTALAALTDAAGHRLVEPGEDGDEHRFVHVRVSEALLGVADAALVRSLHHRIAVQLAARRARSGGTSSAAEVYAIARHHAAAGAASSPAELFAAAVEAGERALAEHAAADALEFLTQALDCAGAAGIVTGPQFHALLGTVAFRVGEYEPAMTHLQVALSAESDRVARARLQCLIAETHLIRSEGDAALAAVDRGLAGLGHPMPSHRGLLVLKALAWALAAGVVRCLPRRLAVVRPDRADHHRVWFRLCGIGAASAAVAMRLPLPALYDAQAAYPARRLGPGPEAVMKLSATGMMASVTRRRRRAVRLLDDARSGAAELDDPQLMASVAWMRALALDFTPPLDGDTGRLLRAAAEEHGAWLGTTDYLTTVGMLGQYRCIRGYQRDVAECYRDGMARSRLAGGAQVDALTTLGAQAAALAGRPAEAARQLAAVRREATAPTGSRGLQVNVAVAAMLLAVEQGDHGDSFDAAWAEFTGLGVPRARLWNFQRVVWVHRAFGLVGRALDRARAAGAAPGQPAGPASVRTALDDADAAVTELRRAAPGPVFAAFADAAAAAVRQLRGDHAGALRLAHRTQERAGGLDVPLLNYELARVRARCYTALGRLPDAGREAAIAQQLAVDHGWPVRARWIRAEFGDRAVAHPGEVEATGTALTAVQRRRLEAVHQVSVAAAQILDPRQLVMVALDEIVRIFGAERAFVFLLEPSGEGTEEELRPFLGRDGDGNRLDELVGYGSTLVERVLQARKPIVVTGSDEGAALGSQSAIAHGLRSIMVAPLLAKGQLRGVVYLDSRAAKGVFTGDDVDILAAITGQVALFLETARAAQLEVAVRAVERERDVAQLLHDLMMDQSGSLDPVQVLDGLAGAVSRALGVRTVVLLRQDPQRGLVVTASRGLPDLEGTLDDPRLHELLAARPAPRGSTVSGTGGAPAVLGPGARAWLTVPLRMREEPFGLLLVARDADVPWTDAEVEIAGTVGSQGMIALEKAQLFDQVQRLATQDPLTGLFNRRRFFEVCEQHVELAHRYGQAMAALMVDIDHFKVINDTYGHPVGDEVIRQVAARLAATVRRSDVLGRYGGEEFAVLLTETDLARALDAALQMHAAVGERPVETTAGGISVTISVGLATPRAVADVQLLLSTADQALYTAKRGGRNRVVRC